MAYRYRHPIIIALLLGLTGGCGGPDVGDHVPVVSDCTAPAAPDFRDYPAGDARKTAFFDYLRPLIACENRHMQALRGDLRATLDKPEHTPEDTHWLARVCARYSDDAGCPDTPESRQRLLQRVGRVPMSLALAQAANESGWGTSRFARRGHNYFGQWCFTPGCGLVPAQRSGEASHEVRAFPNAAASVRSYFMNLNTHDRYQPLRQKRRIQRDNGELRGGALAETLDGYSARGDDYVRELQQIIRANNLSRWDGAPDDRPPRG